MLAAGVQGGGVTLTASNCPAGGVLTVYSVLPSSTPCSAWLASPMTPAPTGLAICNTNNCNAPPTAPAPATPAPAAAGGLTNCPAAASAYAATSCYVGATTTAALGQVCSCYCGSSDPAYIAAGFKELLLSSPDDVFQIGAANTSYSMSGCSTAMCNAYTAAQNGGSPYACQGAGSAAAAGYATAIATTGLPPPSSATVSAITAAGTTTGICGSVTVTCTAADVGSSAACATAAAINTVYTQYAVFGADPTTCATALSAMSATTSSLCTSNNCNAPSAASAAAGAPRRRVAISLAAALLAHAALA